MKEKNQVDEDFDHVYVENHITFDQQTNEYVVWDETEADEAGRSKTLKGAREVMEEYCAYLDKGPIGPYLLRAGKIRAFRCKMVWDVEFDDEHHKPIIAFSYGQAKSIYLRYVSDVWDDVKYTDIRCRCIGKPVTSSNFKRNAEYRSIPFAYVGMVVEIDITKQDELVPSQRKRRFGWIVGHNSSANLDVMFKVGNRLWTDNCHPAWDIRYYDDQGNVIKEFKRK